MAPMSNVYMQEVERPQDSCRWLKVVKSCS